MSAPRLSHQTLASLPDAVARPGYATADLTTGIGHLGLGAFARAHLASYTDPLLNTIRRGAFAASACAARLCVMPSRRRIGFICAPSATAQAKNFA